MGNSTSRLYDAILKRNWNAARALLKMNDAGNLVEYTNETSKQNALHLAYYNTPLDILQVMLNASQTAPLQKDNIYENTPLHSFILCSSEEIIIALLEACPRAACIANNDGRTPLHLAIYNKRLPNIIHHILTANSTAAVTANIYQDTPFYVFFREWNMPLRNKLDSIGSDENEIGNVILQDKLGYGTWEGIYETALLLLQAATHGTIKENHQSPFRTLHAAIINPHCPLSFINLILRVDPKEASYQDDEGNLPIHAATAAKSFFDREFYRCKRCNRKFQKSSWHQHKSNCYTIYCQKCFQEIDLGEEQKNIYIEIKSVDKIPAVIRDLLAINSTFAQIPNHEGKFPLHIAIQNEKSLKEVLEAMLRAAPKALNTRDIKTHLYPFMSAAVEHDRKINMLDKFTLCFALLSENPFLVSSVIQK